MRQQKRQLALLIGGLVLSATAWAATPSGEMLGNNCAGCHGTNGNSQGPATPTIAGISKDYFVDAIKAYKSGDRPSTIMGRIAKGYTDEEVDAMAKFFAEQKFKAGMQMSDKGKAKKGAKLHVKYCEKCHEDGGASSEDDAGILAGQWGPYLHYTMEDFMSGAREQPKKMKKKVEKLHKKTGDVGMDRLMNFYASEK